MSVSRLAPNQADTTQYVDVQANWLGVNISEANGGSFMAPIVWVGSTGLITWQFKFPTLTNSGTSGTFKLLVPELGAFPAQRCGVYHNLNVIAPVLLQPVSGVAELQTSMVLSQNSQCVLRAQISNELLNY